MFINNSNALKNVFENTHMSNYGRPFFTTKDGEALCIKCVKENIALIYDSIDNGGDPQWEVVACNVNWEDNDLYCSHCNEKIEPEYESD